MEENRIPDPLFTLRGDMGAVHSMFFKLNGGMDCIFTSTQSGIVYKWDLKSCREVYRTKISEEACLAIKSVGNYFVTQTKGGEIRIWEENESGLRLKTLVTLDYWGFCKFDISNNTNLVCPQSGSKVKVINIDGKTISILATQKSENCGETMAVKCFSLSGVNYVFVLYESGLLTLYQTDGVKVTELKIISDCPMSLDFDGESKGVIGSSGDTIVGFELTTDLKIVKWKKAVITNAGVNCVVIRPDKKLFVAGCWDARIRLFSMKSFKLLCVLINHKEAIHDVSYSPARVSSWDTEWLLAATGKDGRITLWNLY